MDDERAKRHAGWTEGFARATVHEDANALVGHTLGEDASATC